jgi:hypothetical protein
VKEDADGGALRKEFIPNWTNGEFVVFVEKLEWFVDELWKGVSETEGAGGRERLGETWRELLDVEGVFWPVVEE